MTTFVTAYQGGKSNGSYDGSVSRGIGIATTTDFLSYTKHGEVLAPTDSYQADWKAQQLFDPCLVDPGAGTLHLYCTGWDATTGVLSPGTLGDRSSEEALAGSVFRIGLSTSTDGGRTWSTPSVVLSPGSSGAWDDLNVRHAHVVYDAGEANAAKRWKMWYLGQSGSTDFEIGYAYSADGITWTKFGRVLAAASNGYAGLAVVLSSGTWHIFYGVQVDLDPLHTDIHRVTCTNPESTYTTHGSVLTVPDAYPDDHTFGLGAAIAAGDSHLFIGDTSSFTVGDQIYINAGGGVYALAAVTSIPSSTRLDFTPPVSVAFPSGDVREFWQGAIQPRSIRLVGSTWMLFGTATGMFFEQADPFAPRRVKPPYGRAVVFTSTSLTSGWAIDHTHSPLLALGTETTPFTAGASGWDRDEADALSVPVSGGDTTAFDDFRTPFTDIQHVCANATNVVVIADHYDGTLTHVSIDVAVFDLTGTLLNVWSHPTAAILGQFTGSCLDDTAVYFMYSDTDDTFAKVDLAAGTWTDLFTVPTVDAQVPGAIFGTGIGRGIVEKDGDLIIAGTYGLARVQQDGTLIWWADVTNPTYEYRGLAHSGNGSVWASMNTNTADEFAYDGTYRQTVTIVETAPHLWLIKTPGGWSVDVIYF